ncbi:MAG: transporter substrate-binding domain-containing protein [Ruminococcaceae bacterium]|nr:transporter substrate-binding domain-containing protein [Oscillospiraceae bacterium]
MKFTKVLALTLAVLMLAACFVGCGKVEESASDANIEEKEKLVMATNAYFQPYEYYEGDKIVGIDAEIAAAIAEKLGMELEIKDMQFDSILTAVETGSVDFGMAGMTVTEKRLESVNFTSSYATGVQSIIVKEGSPITTVDDLYAEGAAYKVGVQLGTTGDIYSTDDFGSDNVVQYSNGNEAVMALQGGAVDCVIIDNQPAKALVEANEGLVILETSYADEEYAICVAKENTELLEKLNKAIDELIADGTVDKIIAKYIK